VKRTAIGAYIFAGGFTVGVRNFFDVSEHLEDGRFGADTSEKNLGVTVHSRPAEWLDAAFWHRREPSLIYCNPPCAAWSAAGVKARITAGAVPRDYASGFDPRDERPRCFERCVALLDLAHPEALVVESVQQAWTKGEPFIRRLAERAGTGLDVVLFDAYDCGLPGHRRRVFFVFTDLEIEWRRPDRPGPRSVREAFVHSFGDARGDRSREPECARLNPAYAAILPKTPEGKRLADFFEQPTLEERDGRGRLRGRPGFLHRRLKLDAPGYATGGDVTYHPRQNRLVSVREAAALAGYPVGYDFVAKGATAKYHQINRAVTPPAGAWVAHVLSDAMDVGESRRDKSVRVYDLEGQGR